MKVNRSAQKQTDGIYHHAFPPFPIRGKAAAAMIRRGLSAMQKSHPVRVAFYG